MPDATCFLEKHLTIPTSSFSFTSNTNYRFHYHHQLLQTGLSDYTDAVTTSLIPIDAILPEICTFIVGFSCTAGLK